MTHRRRLALLFLVIPACAPAEAPRPTPITQASPEEPGKAPLTHPPKAIATH